MTGSRHIHLAESERRKPLGLGFVAQSTLDSYVMGNSGKSRKALSFLRSEHR
jgi:hypothetical protein